MASASADGEVDTLLTAQLNAASTRANELHRELDEAREDLAAAREEAKRGAKSAEQEKVKAKRKVWGTAASMLV